MNTNDIRNPLLQSFLSDSNNYQLYKEYCNEPTDYNRNTLEEKFKEYYNNIRTISYFSKAIRFTAQGYDKKVRSLNNRFLLILDSTTDKESSEETQSLEDDILYTSLEDYIQDKHLYDAIKSLTDNQKRILYLAFIKNMTDTEISKILNVTQQAISKSKKNALKKVRRLAHV
ncbi:sigma-70 family RNA polymerase sigma factor [Ornithinibacillus xuwenensis]|uniref:Sigma-70 family RNA polymerase sigma factor n=1 Tax=Ornithinibacillus xuwenensis TaxID=3144668 RepID=A0ABU9XH27_9BACI